MIPHVAVAQTVVTRGKYFQNIANSAELVELSGLGERSLESHPNAMTVNSAQRRGAEGTVAQTCPQLRKVSAVRLGSSNIYCHNSDIFIL